MKSLKQCKIISYHKRGKCAFSPQHVHPYVAEVYFFGKTRENVIVGTEIYGNLWLFTILPHLSHENLFSPR